MLRHPVRVLGNTRAAALVVPSSRAAATSSLAGAILDKEATASKLSEPSSSNPFGLPLPDNKYRGEVKTDTRLLPQDGKTWYSGYDKLSAYNPIATPRPIWDVGVTRSAIFDNGNVPDLRNIEYSWEYMDEDTRGRIQQHLTERAEGDWHDLSVVEKKAAWYIQNGPWGPRAPMIAHGEGFAMLTKATVAFILTVIGYKTYSAWVRSSEHDRQVEEDAAFARQRAEAIASST